MFPKLLQAYEKHGLCLHVGNNNLFAAALVKDGRLLETGGGISLTDVAFFIGLRQIFTPGAIFVVGNAFGYSAFVLAEVFPEASIDVIDAGTEGSFNRLGNDVTVRIAEEFYQNVRLTIGVSPRDLGKAARFSAYDLIFIDGEHSNDALERDVTGLLTRANDQAVMYLHDVGMCSMQNGYRDCLGIGQREGFRGFDVDFTNFGCKALVRNLPDVEHWLRQISDSPCDALARPGAHSSARTTELLVALNQHANTIGQQPVTLASGKRLAFQEIVEGLARILTP